MLDSRLEFIAKQVRRALELLASQITDESTMMEIADIKYGVNADNESQLYQVLQAHTSAEVWKPDESPSLYKKVGVSPSGYPIWTQPLGASDAYQTGDIVQHSGGLWISTVDGNVWEPGVYGWNVYEE